jgi:hypothetical protein
MKEKVVRVARSMMSQCVGTLVDLACGKNIKAETSVAIYSSLLQLQDICRGQGIDRGQDMARGQLLDESADRVNMVVQSAKHATQSRTMLPMQNTIMLPRQGPEANNEGRPRTTRISSTVMARNGGTIPQTRGPKKRTCKFCQSTTKCGNIGSCTKMKELGCRILQKDLDAFLSNDLALTNARHDAIKLQGLTSAAKPILSGLPGSTKWLVLHGLYNLNSMATSSGVTTEAQAVVEVTCYGQLGNILEGLATNAANFDHVIARYTAVRNWIASSATKDIGKSGTRLFTSDAWKCCDYYLISL